MHKGLTAALAAILGLTFGGLAGAAEVRIAPGDFIVLNPTNPNAGYADLIIHAAGVRAGPGERLKVERMTIELLKQGRVVETEDEPVEALVADTVRLAHAPVREFMTGQLLDPKGPDGVFGAPTAFASGPEITAGQALFVTRRHFSVDFNPDAARVTVFAIDANGAPVHVEATVAVHPYKSPIAYRFPLDGAWLERAVPGVGSHHRFNPSTEFASDFFKIDGDGRTSHGDRMDPAAWYGWGQPVRAAADGEVVRVIADQTQDRQAFVPKPGETGQQAGARIEAMMTQRANADFAAAEAGNLITIRHASGDVVEYSSYGHLKSGSVRVKVGDHVVAGQQIAEIGDTGDSPAVHLHFQVNAGPDAMTAKSLPVLFADTRDVMGEGELGKMVTNAPR